MPPSASTTVPDGAPGLDGPPLVVQAVAGLAGVPLPGGAGEEVVVVVLARLPAHAAIAASTSAKRMDRMTALAARHRPAIG
jgi:hypothetical protein